jgi:hypothetical protein
VRKDGFLGHLLDPIDRLSETIYSILILLTFTLAYRIIRLDGVTSDPLADEHASELALAALGATFAWGLIDGVMYVMMEVFQRGERHRLLKQLQAAATEQAGIVAIAEEFDYMLEPISGEQERQQLYRSMFAQLRGGSPRPVGFKRADFAGALGCVLVAVLAVLPSLLPFVLLRNDLALAIRASNVVSFVMLFVAGYQWGQHTGASPWKTGALLVTVGVVMVLIAIPLGG